MKIALCLAVCICVSALSSIAQVSTPRKNKKTQEQITWTLGSSTSLIRQLDASVLRQVKQSGIELIEIGWRDLNWHELSFQDRLARAREVYALCAEAGLRIWSTHVPYGEDVDISNPDHAQRKAAIARVKEFIDLAREMRAEHVVLHASERIDESTRKERIVRCRESLKELSLYIEGKGIALAIETLPPDFMGNSSKEILQLVEGIDRVGICFDTNHLVPEKPEDFVRAAGDKITTVHIADFDGVEQKHWMPGRGVIDWPKVLDELLKAGYSGPFMYEVVRRDNETHTFKDLKANYEMLKRSWSEAK